MCALAVDLELDLDRLKQDNATGTPEPRVD
jgi:hypothetical protein